MASAQGHGEQLRRDREAGIVPLDVRAAGPLPSLRQQPEVADPQEVCDV